jgi:predicted AAA+ superfamily ATPase
MIIFTPKIIFGYDRQKLVYLSFKYTEMINRILFDLISNRLFSGKTILLLGPRQVGKTTLMRKIQQANADKTLWLNADNPDDRELLNHINSSRAASLFPAQSLVIVDEAQRLENSGLTLKISIHSKHKGRIHL